MKYEIPEVIEDVGAWVGPKIQEEKSWIYYLDSSEVDEIDNALQHLKRNNIEVPFAPDKFPLPILSERLDQILDDVEDGLGVALIRGLPRDRYSDSDCAKIYWGIASYLGNPVSQNSRGHRLGHVRDEGKSYDDPSARGYQTSEKMDFHTDFLPVDVLGLFCLRTSKSGGESALISALTIHNEFYKERPDLLKVLYGDFNLDWRDEEPQGEKPYFTIPMFSCAENKTTARITSRQYCESTSRFGAEIGLRNDQREALNKVQEIANRPELRLSMKFQEGDMQFINNHILMHSRTAFEDFEEPGRKRHLLRTWIAVNDERRRPLSDALAGRYKWVRSGGFPEKPEHV
jgi:hypothetical protein